MNLHCLRHGPIPVRPCPSCWWAKARAQETVRPSHEELVAACASEWALFEMVRVEGAMYVVRGHGHGGGVFRYGAGSVRHMTDLWGRLTNDWGPRGALGKGAKHGES